MTKFDFSTGLLQQMMADAWESLQSSLFGGAGDLLFLKLTWILLFLGVTSLIGTREGLRLCHLLSYKKATLVGRLCKHSLLSVCFPHCSSSCLFLFSNPRTHFTSFSYLSFCHLKFSANSYRETL